MAKLKKVANARAMIIGLLALLLPACTTPAKVPEDLFYRLPPISANSGPHLAGTLAVGQIRVDDLYRERSMLYIDMAQPLELRRYHYRYWSQAPDELVRQYLMEYLQSVNAADHVLRYSFGDNAFGEQVENASVDGLIEGRVLRFERLIDAAAVKVQVRLALRYRRVGQSQPDWEKQYNREVSAADNRMQASVVAFGAALQSIFADFLQEIAGEIVHETAHDSGKAPAKAM